MTLARRGLMVAAIQCLLVLSLSGKLLYDRATRPRVWVKTAPWDPSLPLRGRYLALRLTPEGGASWYRETEGAMVLFFVPEHTLPFETLRGRGDAPELWVEVTIPRKGPPRPIRLATKQNGELEPLRIN
jgi:hypothetical protein